MKREEEELLLSIMNITEECGAIFSPDNNNININ